MKIFKRWTSGVVASFEWVANQVENHEALVAAAIREMEESVAKARVQMQRVQKDGSTLKKHLEKAQSDIEVWTERARQSSEENKEKALECIRRKRKAEREAESLKVRFEEHLRVERQLSQDLETVQARLVDLRQKKNSFLARKYNSEAHRAGSPDHVGLIHEIDDIFERWEVRLAQCEPVHESADTFAQEFEEKEELEDLEAELEQLQQA